MKKTKCITLTIFLLFLGYANLAWAGSETATATVRVVVPPKAEVSLSENEPFTLAQWVNKSKTDESLNVVEEEKDGITIYTVSEKI